MYANLIAKASNITRIHRRQTRGKADLPQNTG